MSDTFTLLIWEEVPEETSLYLIPNSVITDDRRALLNAAHNKFINSDEMCDELSFLNVALCDIGNLDDEEYFDDGFSKKEWRCIFAGYKVNKENGPLLNTSITSVVLSGFIL